MAEVKWIKLATDIFDNRKIKLIEHMPDGDTILIIWIKLLCLAGTCNDNGRVSITEEIAYDENTLSIALDKPIMTIKLALDTFEKFGMIEIVDDFVCLSNWEKYQNVDGLERIREQTRLRVARCRADKKKKLLEIGECNVTCNATSNVTVTDMLRSVTHQNKNIDIDIDKDIDINNTTIITNLDNSKLVSREIYDVPNYLSNDSIFINHVQDDYKKIAYRDECYNQFILLYPSHRRRSLSKIKDEWSKLDIDKSLYDKIFKSLEEHKKLFEWTKDNGKWIPSAQNFLANKLWEEDIQILTKMSMNNNSVIADSPPTLEEIENYCKENGMKLNG